jgi:hypothetical protein
LFEDETTQSSLRVRIFVSGRGNVFMTDIAESLRQAFLELNVNATLERSGLPTATSNTLNFVLAPHEYFLLLDEFSEEDRLESARACIPICTEQPGTHRFEEGVKYANVLAGLMLITFN